MLADSIKGSNFDSFSELVIEGIQLHRKLDQFIDSYDGFQKLKEIFYPILGKYSSIALDLYFDYFIANKIIKNGLSYIEYCKLIEIDFISSKQKLPFPMLNLGEMVFEKKWILEYHTLLGVENIMNQMSKRVQNRINFADSIPFFIYNQNLFFDEFEYFYQYLRVNLIF